MNTISDIRPSPIAGTWYANNPQVLATEIDQFLEEATEDPPQGKVIGLIAPHAGFRYSGSTAGEAFHLVQGQEYPLVVILSPYHPYHSGIVLSSAHKKYTTPLGEVAIDQDLLSKITHALRDTAGIRIYQLVNDQEHSLEIEIPFLQRALSAPFNLLPLMIRSVDPIEARLIADEISKLIAGLNPLVVISTDLSHFYPQEVAEKLDLQILSAIASFSEEAVYETEKTGKGYACGLGAIQVGLALTRSLGADSIKILSYTTSAEKSGDRSSVVGYGAAAIMQTVTEEAKTNE